MVNHEFKASQKADSQFPKIGDWLWRPRRARIWLSAIPFYWGGMVGSLYLEPLENFFQSAFAGFANVFFFPPIVALILSFGYIKARIRLLDFDRDADAEDYFERWRRLYGPSGMPRQFDPLDPKSGTFWIGNPLNPRHPSNINRVS